jgi:hypothetical protein
LRERLGVMYKRHVEMLNQTAITDIDLQGTATTLHRLERFWIGVIDVSQQPEQFAA